MDKLYRISVVVAQPSCLITYTKRIAWQAELLTSQFEITYRKSVTVIRKTVPNCRDREELGPIGLK